MGNTMFKVVHDTLKPMALSSWAKEAAKKFSLTAGLPFAMESLVGLKGKVWGMTGFGYSAPFSVLDEKLGFTAENVYEQVMKYINQ